ncbi:hypothetical protein PENTCL1PPCAC_809 [Pristionchus entomophagus]|uniref:Uncharacterized protein n=1 Tax=Pristionchus entomophagus TaxID=358040 RepID=A0AAV5S895_9BILA|nr:hypothetical protein PENTCL1PPCAC_809 [Pristionchus entomophagus]
MDGTTWLIASVAMMESLRSRDLFSSAVFSSRKDVSGITIGVWKFCCLATLGHNIYEIGKAIKKDYERGTARNTVHASADILGGWAGSIPCATFGASLASKVTDSEVGALVAAVVVGTFGSECGTFLASNSVQFFIARNEENNQDEEEE